AARWRLKINFAARHAAKRKRHRRETASADIRNVWLLGKRPMQTEEIIVWANTRAVIGVSGAYGCSSTFHTDADSEADFGAVVLSGMRVPARHGPSHLATAAWCAAPIQSRHRQLEPADGPSRSHHRQRLLGF